MPQRYSMSSVRHAVDFTMSRVVARGADDAHKRVCLCVFVRVYLSEVVASSDA